MDLQKTKKQWNDYSEEFDNSDFMDIEKHISMAEKVGSLISYAEKMETKYRNLINSIVNVVEENRKL